VLVIHDAYNANPESMAAAIGVLADMPATGRRIAVLGDMAELGDDGPAQHRAVGRRLAEARIDHAVLLGPLMRHAHEQLPDRSDHHDPLTDILIDAIADRIEPGDVVLLKASRLMKLERIADALARRFTTG
jgi:UDP-N-acetylmuramyl pentapeptide synthase